MRARTILRRIAASILFSVGAICAFLVIVARFSNPDWSETRLFLETWPVIAALWVSVIGGVKLVEGEGR